jgi:Ion channel
MADPDVAEAEEGTIEAKLPGFRYGIVLLLLFMTFIVEASGFDGNWYRAVTVALQGATLVMAFVASGVGRHLMRIACVVAVLAFLGALTAALDDAPSTSAAFTILSFLLVVAAPVVIARAIARRGVVDIHTVLGALCIYLMLGMLFSFLYGSIDGLSSHPFFSQTAHATSADFVYFSFVTLTTTGYGDFTAATGLGRAVSVLEALSGQLYLVVVVALLVGRMATSNLVRLREQDLPSHPAGERSSIAKKLRRKSPRQDS